MASTPSTLGPGPKDVLTPQDAFAQSQLQRRLALAQMLQQNAQEAGGAYGSLNGMRAVPRMGIGPAISQIAQSLLGGYEQKKAIGDQQALAQQMAQRQQQEVDNLYSGGGNSGSLPADGIDPRLGISKAALASWYRQDPSAAAKFVGEHTALTNENLQGVQQGRSLPVMGQLADAIDRNKGTLTLQPNTTNIVPGVASPVVAADFANGTVGGYDNSGQPTLQSIQGSGVISQLAGQKQLATQLNTITPVTMSNGAVVPMTGAQALGGQSPQMNSAQQTATGGNGLSSPDFFNTVNDLAGKYGATITSGVRTPEHNAAVGGVPNSQHLTGTAADLVIPPENKAQFIKEAQARGLQPIDEGNHVHLQNPNGSAGVSGVRVPVGSDGNLSPIPVAPNATGIGQSTQDKALADKRAGNIADTEQDINDKAASAQAKLANNQKMMALIPTITKGPLAGHITDAKNLLNSMGWTGPDPTNNQEFEKYAMQAALESAKQVYGNRITNADLMSLPHWNPSANMTENALRTIIDTDNTKQQRMLQKQNVYNDYRNKGGDLNQFNSWFNTNYPDQGIAASPSLAPGAKPSATAPSAAGWSVKRVQ